MAGAIELAKLLVPIEGDTSKLSSALTTAGNDTQSFGDRLGGAIGAAGKAVAGFALAAGAAVVGGIAALGAGLVSCVKEAAAAELVTAQLEAVLKSTGGAAGWTADEALSLADSLAKVTMYEDDAIVGAENLLLTFTNISGDVLPAATEAVLNVSQAMGQDLKSSAVQLGKALNDPVDGMGALTRVGVTFTDAQKDMVKALVESGDTMGAQQVILAELEKEFGGAAKAAGETFAGQLAIAKNQIGDIKETIGAAALPALTALGKKFNEALNSPEVQAAIANITQWLADNLPKAIDMAVNFVTGTLIPAFQGVWSFISDNIIPIFKTVASWLTGEGTTSISGFSNTLTGVLAPALEMGKALFQGMIDWVVTNWPMIQQTIETVITTVSLIIETVLTTIAEFWATNGQTIIDTVTLIWGTIWTVITEVLNTIWVVISEIVSSIVAYWEENHDQIMATVTTIWNAISATIQTVISTVQTVVTTVLTAIRDFWTQHGDEIMAIVQRVWEFISTTVMTVVNIVSGIIQTVFTAIRDFIQTHGDDIQNIISTAWTLIQSIITAVLNFVQPFVQTVLGYIQDFWQTHGDKIVEIAQLAWELIMTVVQTVINAIQTVVTFVTGIINDVWQKHGDQIMAIADKVWNTIKTVIGGVLDAIKGILQFFIDVFKGNWDKLGQDLLAIWDGIWTAIKTIPETVWNAIVNFFKGLDLAGIGRSLLQGIADGIRNGIGIIGDAIKAAADAAWQAIKDFFGIGSPSRLMMLTIGLPIAQGIGVGVLKGMPKATADILGSMSTLSMTMERWRPPSVDPYITGSARRAESGGPTPNNVSLTIHTSGTVNPIPHLATLKAMAA